MNQDQPPKDIYKEKHRELKKRYETLHELAVDLIRIIAANKPLAMTRLKYIQSVIKQLQELKP
jgi:hypothetical protein